MPSTMPVKRACTARPIARVVPPGCSPSVWGQCPATSPMICRKAARAGMNSRCAGPPMARKRDACLIPGLARINALRKIRHEEHVEVGQVIGHVLGRQDQVLEVRAVFGRGQPLRLGQRVARRRGIAKPSKCRKCAGRKPAHRPAPCQAGFARTRDKAAN